MKLKNILLFLLIFTMFTNIASAAWADSNSPYRTNVPISNGSRPYQLSLNISNATGTNNATHIYCNSYCNTNFTDIRFYLQNSTSLSYWIENNTTGRVWVNVTANGSVQMYYGNTTYTSLSNGNNTFIQWAGSTSSEFIYPTQSTITNVAFETIARQANINSNVWWGMATSMTDTPVDGQFVKLFSTNYYNIVFNNSASTTRNTAGFITAGQYYRMKFTRNATEYQGYINDTVFMTPITTNLPDAPMGIGMNFQDANTGDQLWSFLRYYFTPEPQWSTWGGQEALSNITYIQIISSDTARYSNSTTKSLSSNVPVELKRFVLNNSYNGTFRIKFEMYNLGTSGHAQIYKDSVAWGADHTFTVASGNYETFTENFNVNNLSSGTIIQLYAWGTGGGGAVSNRNYNISFDYTYTNESLSLVSPANNSTSLSPVTLTWKEWPLNSPYTYQVSTDNQFINIISSGTGTTNETPYITTTQSLSPGTYYWHVKNATGSYTDWFNFTIIPVPPTPGRLNLSVYSESNTSLLILNYTATVYDMFGNFTLKSTTTGYLNFTAAEITSGQHLVRVTDASGYYERSMLFDSPGNLTMYLPSISDSYLVVFVLSDYTGQYPFLSSMINVSLNNTVVYSSFFGIDAKVPVFLSNSSQYVISLTNSNNTIIWGTYSPYVSTEVAIVITTIQPELGAINYNVTDSPASINLNWSAESGNFQSLNYNIYNSTGINVFSQTTSVLHGEIIYTKPAGNDSYYVVFNASTLNNGVYNSTYLFDSRTQCEKMPGTVFCGFTYGTYTLPKNIIYTACILLIIFIALLFIKRYEWIGTTVILIFVNLFYAFDWLPQITTSDGTNWGTLFFGMLFLISLWFIRTNEGE